MAPVPAALESPSGAQEHSKEPVDPSPEAAVEQVTRLVEPRGVASTAVRAKNSDQPPTERPAVEQMRQKVEPRTMSRGFRRRGGSRRDRGPGWSTRLNR